MRYVLPDWSTVLRSLGMECAVTLDGLRTWPRVDERAIVTYTRV
jgi:hypothetical protein